MSSFSNKRKSAEGPSTQFSLRLLICERKELRRGPALPLRLAPPTFLPSFSSRSSTSSQTNIENSLNKGRPFGNEQTPSSAQTTQSFCRKLVGWNSRDIAWSVALGGQSPIHFSSMLFASYSTHRTIKTNSRKASKVSSPVRQNQIPR